MLDTIRFFHEQDAILGSPEGLDKFRKQVQKHDEFLKGLIKEKKKGDVHYLLFESKELGRELKAGIRFVGVGGRHEFSGFGVGGNNVKIGEIPHFYPGVDPLLAAKIGLEHELPDGNRGTIAFAITPDTTSKSNKDIVHHVGVLDANGKLHIIKMRPRDLYERTTNPPSEGRKQPADTKRAVQRESGEPLKPKPQLPADYKAKVNLAIKMHAASTLTQPVKLREPKKEKESGE